MNRLDRIEDLARSQAAVHRPDSADLITARAKLQAEREAWEETRRVQLEEFDQQRKLLGEAWERLEEAQVEHSRSAQFPAHDPLVQMVPATSRVFRSANIDTKNDPITQDILRHFHALRRDVRRNADVESAIHSSSMMER
jgi:hypothetical protein